MASSAKSVASWRNRIAPCAFAIAISILTLQVRNTLEPWLGERPSFGMFILPIILSAYIGGLWPGFLATVTSAVGIFFFVLKPRHIFLFEGSVDLWNWAIMIVAGVLISVLMEELLRSRRRTESTSQLNEVTLASIGDAVVSRTLDGTIISWNRGAERIFGYTAAEAVGRTLPELLPPARGRENDELFAKVASGATVENIETVRVCKGGKLVSVSATVSPMRDRSGKVVGISKIIRDITDKKIAEERLAREQARFKLIFDTIPIGIAFHTVYPDGTTTRSINEAHLRIAGITRAEHDEPDIYTRITHPDDHAIQQQFIEQVKGGAIKHYSMEKRYLHRDGKTVWVSYSYQREVYADGTIVELTTVTDITAQKQLAEQLRQSQKMEAVGQLSGGIAHDFNNILCVILGQASMLQMGALTPAEHANSLQQILQAAERAANLTRQLLAFSRRQIIQTRPLDLNETTSSMIKMLQRLIGEHIVLQTRYASESAFVQADPGMIEQVLLNLAVNSRDAMPNGGEIFIETQAVHLDTPAVREKGIGFDFVRLSVRDTGCGIVPEHLPRIFEPFFTTKEVGKGTGLGLATVFGIIEQHQGWIEVESEVGKGTKFEIYLPRLQKAAMAASDEPLSFPAPGNGETILIVEDEPALRALTRNTLERLGYKVLEAASGRLALDIWAQHPETQVLLTDLVMPDGLSGRDLAARLLEQRRELKVIYMSGYPGYIAGRGLSLREGLNFLQKPFSPIKLAEIVALALNEG